MSKTKLKERNIEMSDKVIMMDMDGACANSIIKIYDWISERENLYHKELKSDPLFVRKLYLKTFNKGLELIFDPFPTIFSKIIEETDADIVWSTDWRLYEPYKSNINSAQEMLTRHGYPGHKLVAYTPKLRTEIRGNEIGLFLKNHPEYEKCAIIDDREDAGWNVRHSITKLFKTDEQVGLTEEIAEEVIKYLNK